MEAIHLYKITRLADRIANLKKMGHFIRTDMIGKIEEGRNIRYARYTLIYDTRPTVKEAAERLNKIGKAVGHSTKEHQLNLELNG